MVSNTSNSFSCFRVSYAFHMRFGLLTFSGFVRLTKWNVVGQAKSFDRIYVILVEGYVVEVLGIRETAWLAVFVYVGCVCMFYFIGCIYKNKKLQRLAKIFKTKTSSFTNIPTINCTFPI